MALPTSQNEVTVRRLASLISGLWTKITNASGNKADKVSGATNGNFAGLDSNGNLTDSGSKASDFATAAQGEKADSAIQSVEVNGVALTPDANKAVNVEVPTASTSNPLMDGTASAGSSTSWAKGDHVHPTDTSREAAANKASTLDPTSTTEFPTSKAAADFVNSSIATSTATFLGSFTLTDLSLTYPATDAQIATALDGHTWPTGVTPDNNDYVYVEVQNPATTGVDDVVKRFKFNGTNWAFEYKLNNSSFTAAEMAALESGIDSTKVAAYDAHIADTDIHVTTQDKAAWNGKAAGDHTHSVTVNGVAKTIPAPGASAVELMDEMTAQEVQDILDACV